MSDNKTGKKKVCIACGGSAGHIFPGLALAQELVRNYGDNIEVSFLTSDNKLGEALLKERGFDFHTLPLKGLKIGSAREGMDFISNLFKGSLKSMRIILSNKPDCFVGFGAYVSGPPFVAASLSGVPTLIHEQNAVMGRANKIMRRFATRVALSFPEEAHLSRRNVVVTGNPIRESASRIRGREIAIEFLGLGQDRFTILVIGGSQGSQRINSAAIEVFKSMERDLKDRIQVIHISGEKDYERLKTAYIDVDILYKLYPFFEGMGIIYDAADISISRAGASAIFELCAHGIPSVLIPYPFAGGHQLRNALYLAKRGAALMLEEGGLSETTLRLAILKLMEDKSLRESMREKMGKLATLDAARRLANEVSTLVGLH